MISQSPTSELEAIADVLEGRGLRLGLHDLKRGEISVNQSKLHTGALFRVTAYSRIIQDGQK
jgi:hypothetical protein